MNQNQLMREEMERAELCLNQGDSHGARKAVAAALKAALSQPAQETKSGLNMPTFDQWLKREQPAGCVSDMERGWKACVESRRAVTAAELGAPAFLGTIDRFDLNDEDGLLDWARDGAWVRFDAVESALAEVNKPELVKWQYRWLNPRKCQDASDEELAWKDVELTWPHKTLETKVKELEEYRLSGMVLYECRPLYAGPRPPSVDGPVEEKEN